jgi:nitrous oxide reductase
MEEERAGRPRRRGLVTALAVAAAIAAVPAGVALAGSDNSGQSSGGEAQSGPDATSIQATPPGDGNRDRDGDGRDCPKDRQGDSSDTTEL